jgi:hypothetical protein
VEIKMSETQTLDSKVTKIGRLADIFPLFEKSTISTSAQLMNEKRTDVKLRNKWHYTANAAVYTNEKRNAVLYFVEGADNPIYNNISESTKQLIEKQNYEVKNSDLESIVSSKQTLKVELSKLKLQGTDDEWRYFEIDTSKYDKTLNKTQRAFAEKVYGKGRDFRTNMKMLSQANISKTKIYVLNPEYVLKKVQEGKAVARACWLNGFDLNSDFYAYDRSVGGNINALRGVLKKTAEGGAKNLDAEQAINYLLDHKSETVNALTITTASGLSELVAAYIKK